MKRRPLKKKSSHLVPLVVMSVLVIAAIISLWSIRESMKKVTPASTTSAVTSGPTASQQSSAATQVEKPTTEGSDSNPTAAVTPVITRTSQDATTISVYAYVNSPVTGSCSATFTKDGNSVVSPVVAATLATSYYQCGVLTVPLSSLSSGTWVVTVHFAGDATAGTSVATNVVVNPS